SKAGSFWWQATYSGDTNNTGPVKSVCSSEPLTINPNQTSEEQTLALQSQSNLVSLHQMSTISGATSNAGGTVSYAVYTNNTCTTLAPAGYGFNGQPTGGALDVHSFPTRRSSDLSKAGSFWWQATYSGDTNNTGPVKSVCSSEPLTINPNQPSISTLLSEIASANVGTVVTVTSRMRATSNADGTVSYAVYTNNTCTTLAAVVNGIIVQPTGRALPPGSPLFPYTTLFRSAGSFWWQATYSGDTNNTGPVKSVCSSEPLTINPNQPSISTLLS